MRLGPDVPVALVAGLVTLVLLGTESSFLLITLLLDGSYLLLLLGPPALLGVGLLSCRRGTGLLADRVVPGAALGIGLLSFVVLFLGLVGRLSQASLGLALAAMGIAGLVLTLLGLQTLDTGRTQGTRWRWLWLAACPFLALTIAAAALPPGMLWAEEGFGYDVLEYHLAVPKEFFAAGGVHFLPHNTYSNFPLNGEMLWLGAMVLRGADIEASFLAGLVNVALAMLFAAAAWWAARPFGPRAGVLAGVLAATAPWVGYLAGIVYVEPGMLALGMAALGAAIRTWGQLDTPRPGSPGPAGAGGGSKLPNEDSAACGEEPSARLSPGRRGGVERFELRAQIGWALLAGVLAGLCWGFKYTAGPLIVLPIGLTIVLAAGPLRGRIVAGALYAITALALFSPWLVRNQVNTGNPVFPLAWSIFGANPALWDSVLEERWQNAHGAGGSGEEGASPAMLALDRSFADVRMGPAVVLLALAGMIRKRDRLTLVLLGMLALQLGIWAMATHLFARFAAVLLLPLVMLAARIAAPPYSRAWPVAALALGLGAAVNIYALAGLYYHHTRIGAGGEAIKAFDRTDLFVKGDWPGTEHIGALNALPEGSRVLLVGEARTFYLRRPCTYATVFNRHPLEEAARLGQPKDVLGWLTRSGYTHVLVHWGEVGRLRRTYGFPEELDNVLFDGLEQAGMRRAKDFTLEPGQAAYATLYEVPGAQTRGS